MQPPATSPNEYKKPVYRTSYLGPEGARQEPRENKGSFQKEIDTVPCQYCGRQFLYERITKHQQVCEKKKELEKNPK